MLQEVAEGSRLIHLSVAQEILASCLAMVEGEEHRLYHIADIDKGDVLLFVTNSEIYMLIDAFAIMK